jgi:flagellar biosynthetic protein FlhB
MAEQEQDRTEQATPYRLEQARGKGSVARSAEVNSVFAVAAFVGFLAMWGASSVQSFIDASTLLLQQSHALSYSQAAATAWLLTALLDALTTLGPLLVMVVVAAIVSGILQFGVVFTTHPIKPDWERVNPMAGFKRIFSGRALFEARKNVAKLVLFSVVLTLTVLALLPTLIGLLYSDHKGYAAVLIDTTSSVASWLLLALLAVALVDMVYSRREYARKMMMSRRDLKDEYKHREGDPKVKARIRELQSEMRRKSKSLGNVKTADVLITNPTHLAVALSYRHGEMAAPQITAKGAGDMVEAMKKIARRHGVLIVENRPLARALYRQQRDSSVPEQHYAQVARILLWVQEVRQRRAPRSTSP